VERSIAEQKIIKCDIDGVLRNFTNGVYYSIKANLPQKAPTKNPTITQ